ncbi:hypothetical protein AB0J43_34825 [Nonomuraea fuscirosea]
MCSSDLGSPAPATSRSTSMRRGISRADDGRLLTRTAAVPGTSTT